jgi:hypothetical protein
MPVLAGVRSRLCRVEELQERVARVGDGPRIVRSHAETPEEVTGRSCCNRYDKKAMGCRNTE